MNCNVGRPCQGCDSWHCDGACFGARPCDGCDALLPNEFLVQLESNEHLCDGCLFDLETARELGVFAGVGS